MTTEKKKGQRLDKLRPSKKVLLFGSNMILAAIVKSVRTAADILSSGGGKPAHLQMLALLQMESK